MEVPQKQVYLFRSQKSILAVGFKRKSLERNCRNCLLARDLVGLSHLTCQLFCVAIFVLIKMSTFNLFRNCFI